MGWNQHFTGGFYQLISRYSLIFLYDRSLLFVFQMRNNIASGRDLFRSKFREALRKMRLKSIFKQDD